MSRHYLRVDVSGQSMSLMDDRGNELLRYPVSTARHGLGELRDSGCTPRGWHVIRAVIGLGCPSNTVFRGRRPTGELHDSQLDEAFPGRDWILGRILWLGGIEPGLNRYGKVDTASRYIYIHGSPDRGVDGTPQSHGCIRMRCDDVVALAQRVMPGDKVHIIGAKE